MEHRTTPPSRSSQWVPGAAPDQPGERRGRRLGAPRRSLATGVALVVLATLATACELPPPWDSRSTAEEVVTDRDTFTVSTKPTVHRGRDTALRVMNGTEAQKVAYVSFPVDRSVTGPIDATLYVVPQQDGFTVRVHDTGAFTDSTNHLTRPKLGATVGTLARTAATQRQAIALGGVPVRGGRVNLALTTTSRYELELVSLEGAIAAKAPHRAPTLVTGAPAPAQPTPGSTAPAAPATTTTLAPTTPEPAPSSTTAPSTTAPASTTTPATTTPLPTPPVTTAPAPPPAPVPAGWKLTFADEFDGTRVDTTKWNVYDQAKGDTVESPKASTCTRADNVSVGNGILVMRTQRANGGCTAGQAHSGAGMNTWGTFSQAGGRFEARGRWTDRGNYLWGGFWTHGNITKGWAKDNATEIDIWEYIGKNAEPNISRFKPAIHYNYTCEGTCGMQNLQYLNYDVTAWHEYAIEWEPTDPADPTTMQIRFYLDGRQIAQFDKHGTWRVTASGTKVLETAGGWKNPKGAFPNPFGLDRAHQLVLSAWVGAPGVDAATVARGYNPAAGHADLEIDYVRVYTR